MKKINLDDYVFNHKGSTKGVLKIDGVKEIDVFLDSGSPETIWYFESTFPLIESKEVIDIALLEEWYSDVIITDEIKKRTPYVEYSIEISTIIKKGYSFHIKTDIKREITL